MTPRTSGASPSGKVRDFYDGEAEAYAKIMDSEIDLPLYSDVLGRLAERIASVRGPLVDTSCGPGHMLHRYRERYDPERQLVGVDLSPRMVALAAARCGGHATMICGDMRKLPSLEHGPAAAVLSFFAVHHLDPDGIRAAVQEWHRILGTGGQLVMAAWEGGGPIDYGDAADVVAFRYTAAQLVDAVKQAGFVVDRSVVDAVDGMPMDAVYVEATKQTDGHTP